MRYAATAAEAALNNVILAKGELGYTADDDVLKVGDGVRHWNDLEPVAGGGGGGGGGFTPTAKTANYTAASGELVLVNATSGAVTITLPASPTSGMLVAVKKTDASVNVVTVAPQGGATIDGDANATLTGQWASVSLMYDGTRWDVIGSAYGSGTAAHATTHAAAGSDPVTLAASQIGSGVLATDRLGSGTPAAGKYVDGAAGAWTTLPVLRTGKVTATSMGTVTTSWAAAGATTTALDLDIAAVVGDVVLLGISGRAAAAAGWLDMDVATIVSSAIVNYCSGAGSGGSGAVAWQVPQELNAIVGFGGAIAYTVQSGDISSGSVKFRPIAKYEVANRQFAHGSTGPFQFWAVNLSH